MQEYELISIICPCFNEENALASFFKSTSEILNGLNIKYEYVCINDGSTDTTLNILLGLKKTQNNLRIINFSRNFGKEAAISAGIDYAIGDALIFIDVDLQDPPELIPKMLDRLNQGFDVILAKRVDRSSDTQAKQLSAQWYYKFYNLIAEVKIPENVGDYRIITRRVADVIKLLPENQRFMKGIFAWVGYKTDSIEYTRKPRSSGTTKFSPCRLYNLAIQGITSFSSIPLKIWTYIGLFISSLSLFFGLWIMVKTLIWGVDMPGYASIMTTILFLGGIQLISIGVLGEYIGRIYMETKQRPNYIVENEY